MDSTNLGNGKGITIIDSISREKVESLYVSSLKLLYYLNVNFLYNTRKEYNDNSDCNCFQKNIKNKCNICFLLEKFNIDEIDKDYNQKAIVKTNIALKNYLKKNIDLKVSTEDYKFTNCYFSELIFIQNSTIRERIEVYIFYF